jgi:protein tyrosine phosphatase
MSPGCNISPYELTDRQREVSSKILSLRKEIQAANPDAKNDKATVLADKKLFLTGAFIAECYYSTNQDIVLVSCLTRREGRTTETRPNSIFAYNVKDCESINILRKIDIIVEWIDKQIQDGKTVIIHCYAGINRSASIALAYHCLKTGNDIVTGFRYLAEQRPGILSNTKFIEQLVIWADAHGLLPEDV